MVKGAYWLKDLQIKIENILKQNHIDSNDVRVIRIYGIDGMERRLKEMVSLMPIDSNDVRVIGIYGIDGIGKTTLAKVVYNKIVHQFDGASFLLNISSREKGLWLLPKSAIL